MLNIPEDYANSEHYTISETKSVVLCVSDKDSEKRSFRINNSEVPVVETATHLGIPRDNCSKFGTNLVAEERISSARKAVYAMMGAGLHGINGLNPLVSMHLIKIYIIPRLVYGLDVVRLTIKDMNSLMTYFKRLLKQIQHLPDRTSDSATYMMLGEPPIIAEIHKRVLTTFGSICRDYDSIENQIAWRQLSLKDKKSNSWFILVHEILSKYNLPSAFEILENPIGKCTWKIWSMKLSIHFGRKR